MSRINNEISTPNRSGAVVRTVTSSSPIVNSKQIVVGHKASAEEIKEKMEQELRLQRAEHHKKRTLEMMQQKKGKNLQQILLSNNLTKFPTIKYFELIKITSFHG